MRDAPDESPDGRARATVDASTPQRTDALLPVAATDGVAPFPDLPPLADAGQAIQRSLTLLTRRRFLAMTEVEATALDRPALPPRRYADAIQYGEFPEWRFWGHGRGVRGTMGALPDGGLVLAEPSDCGGGVLLRRFDGPRVSSLGRFAAATCGISDASGVIYSKDGRWAAIRWDDVALRLDGTELATEWPECEGRFDGRSDFVAWDGEDTALVGNPDCLKQVDLPTGAATEIPLPAEDCTVVIDTTRSATRIGGRLLFSCPRNLALVDADGDAEFIAARWSAVRERAAVPTPVGATLLVTDDWNHRRAVLTLSDGEAVTLRVMVPKEDALVVADTITGAAHLVTVEPAPPDAAVPGADAILRVDDLNPDGTATFRASALVPAGALASAVVGDAATGPVFVSLNSASGETTWVHVLRARGERVATETFALPIAPRGWAPELRPWPGEPDRAVLASSSLSVVDARGAVTRLAPLGDPMAYVFEPGRVRMFSYEAEAEVATLGPDAPLVVGEPVTGNASLLGSDRGETREAAVLHDSPHVGFGAPARVDFIPAGETRPARSVAVAGETLGMVGDWVVSHIGDRFEAVHRVTSQRATVGAGAVPLVDFWLVPDAGTTMFTFDQEGTFRRVDFTQTPPRVRVVATGIPGGPARLDEHERTGLVFDRSTGDVLFSVFNDLDSGRVYRFSGVPEVPYAAPSPVVESPWQLAIVLAQGGGRALTWEYKADGTTVWLVCLGDADCPAPRPLAVIPDADVWPYPDFQLSPDGRLLVDSDGVTRDLESGGPAVVPSCVRGDCSRPWWPNPDPLPSLRFSPDGRRAQFWPNTVFLPADGQIIGLADEGAEAVVSALTPDGAIAAVSGPGGAIRLRHFDRTLHLLDELDAAVDHGAEHQDLRGELLGAGGDFVVWQVTGDSPEFETRLFRAEIRAGGEVTPIVVLDGEVSSVW